MRLALLILGILLALGGTVCGVLNWWFTEFYLETVDWEGPMVVVNRITWVLNILGMGLGVILIGVAAMIMLRYRVQPALGGLANFASRHAKNVAT